MKRYVLAALCVVTVLAGVTAGQNAIVEPIRAASGSILTFYLQTRLHPTSENLPDVLPSGTELHVKILDRMDSAVDHDGAEFHGVVVSPVVEGNETILHADAEVRGILVLLRSKSHPDGFRYDLLITHITDHGKSYSLTASLGTSVFEPNRHAASAGAAK
jgi:hypothetical protein